MTTFGQEDRLMTTFGQKGQLMTTCGWRDCDAIWWEQLYVLLQLQGFVNLVDMPWWLIASACLAGQCSQSLGSYITFNL